MRIKNKAVIVLLSVLCVIAVAVMIIALVYGDTAKTPGFIPPAFDSTAVSGVPDTAEASWSRVYKDGMGFSAHVCGKVITKSSSADVYFTNDEGNTVWLKLRITDENGNILGETGLLKPNEYVKSIKFDTVPTEGAKIKLKIMAYEPDTYYSAGAVSLNTTIGG